MTDHPTKPDDPEESRSSAQKKQPRLPLEWDLDELAKRKASQPTAPATGAETPAAPEDSEPEIPARGTEASPEPMPEAVPVDDIAEESSPEPVEEAALPEPDEDVEEAEDEESEEPEAAEQVVAQAPATEKPETARRLRLPSTEVSLGQSLIEGRGACNLSISQVAQKTKIPPTFIDAIESDRFSELPPPVYTRSYISQLCRLYGMDPGPLLKEYAQLSGGADGPHAAAVDVSRFALARESEGGTVKYGPPGMKQADTGRLVDRISRIAVVGALGLLVLLVLIAVAVQQVKNYQMRRSERIIQEHAAPTPADASTTLEELIIPQQLPLEELEIPGGTGEEAGE